MPTSNELRSSGRSDIDSAIGRHHGGYLNVNKKLGYKHVKKRPNGYWSDFSNLKNELVPICEKFGRMPTVKELKQEGLSSCKQGINQHGGRSEVAKRLGYSLKTVKHTD